MYAPRTAAPGQEHMPPAAPHWQYPVPASSQPLPPHAGPYYTAAPAPPPSSLPPIGEHRPADMALRHPHAPPPHAPHHAHYPPPHDPRYPPPAYGYPPAHGHYGPPPHQPAPRQRTAIACRYCRRRKIRCSGFDTAEDGRCSNCARFSQECVFTPVSAQAQAFVPAHAVYGRQPTQLYGAYGQPLPAGSGAAHDPYGRPPVPPHAAYPPYGAPAPGPYGTPPYDDRSTLNGNRKRPNEEPHTPTLPPPNPGIPAAMPRSAYPEQDLGYRYPDPTAAAAPAPTPYAGGPPPPTTQHPPGPYYAPQPPARRVSPVLASPYSSVNDGQRSSLSPNTSNLPPPTTPGLDGHVPPQYNAADYRTAAAAAAVAGNASEYSSTNGNGDYKSHTSAPAAATGGAERKTEPTKAERSPPNQTATPVSASSNSSATNGAANGTASSRPGLAISSIVSGDGLSPGGRSTTDSAMLNKLK